MGGGGSGRGVGPEGGGGGGWGRGMGQGTFHPPCYILHYHMVLRPKGTSHNNAPESPQLFASQIYKFAKQGTRTRAVSRRAVSVIVEFAVTGERVPDVSADGVHVAVVLPPTARTRPCNSGSVRFAHRRSLAYSGVVRFCDPESDLDSCVP